MRVSVLHNKRHLYLLICDLDRELAKIGPGSYFYCSLFYVLRLQDPRLLRYLHDSCLNALWPMIRAACLLCVLVVTQALRNARFLVRGKSHLSAMPQSFSQMGNYPQEKDPKESFDEYWNRPGPWDEKELGSLMDANKAWTDRMTTLNPTYFSDHERGHAPKILWIGCSDARVPANEIIGEPPGNVFVHRNIANQVVNTDFNCMSVIQYAVDVLEVKHIIVCGHYDCGGVKAALTNMDHKAPLENWLRNIRGT